MDSLTHFHSRNVYFYIHYSNSLKVTALDMLQKILGSHPRQNEPHHLEAHLMFSSRVVGTQYGHSGKYSFSDKKAKWRLLCKTFQTVWIMMYQHSKSSILHVTLKFKLA